MTLPTKKKIEEEFIALYDYYTYEQILHDLEFHKEFSKEQSEKILSIIKEIRMDNLLKEQMDNNEKRDEDEKFIFKSGRVSVWHYYNYYCKGMLIIRARDFANRYYEKFKTMSYDEYYKASWEYSLVPLHKDLWDKRL